MENQKKHKQELLRKIRGIEEEIKQEKGNNNISVRYYEDCELTLGGKKIKVSVAEIDKNNRTIDKEDNEKYEDTETVKTYNIYMNVKGKDIKIAEINEEGRLIINEENLKKIDHDNVLGLKELGEEEKPDLSEINRIEGKTAEELEAELGEEERSTEETRTIDEGTEKENEEERPDKSKDETKKEEQRNLKKLNISVLKVLYPQLKDCKDAYLDLNTNNSLVFEDKDGVKHTPEEYGFAKGKTETGSFQLNKMDNEGKISSYENPTTIYTMGNSDYGISIDFKEHHKAVNIAVKGRDEHHANSYSVIEGNLTIADSGQITQYQGKELTGIKEGRDAGERNETNEKAGEFLSSVGNKDAQENFRQGFQKEMRDGRRVNDATDLKRVIAQVLQEKYNESRDDATEIATEIVDKGRDYDEIKKERDMQKENDESDREKTPWDDAMARRGF